MVERDLATVRRLVTEALQTDQLVFLEHGRGHAYRPTDIRVILMHGKLGYGKPGPEGERYTADVHHPTLGPSRVVFSIQEPTVIVVSAYEEW
jgi:hypothetical protein